MLALIFAWGGIHGVYMGNAQASLRKERLMSSLVRTDQCQKLDTDPKTVEEIKTIW